MIYISFGSKAHSGFPNSHETSKHYFCVIACMHFKDLGLEILVIVYHSDFTLSIKLKACSAESSSLKNIISFYVAYTVNICDGLIWNPVHSLMHQSLCSQLWGGSRGFGKWNLAGGRSITSGIWGMSYIWHLSVSFLSSSLPLPDDSLLFMSDKPSATLIINEQVIILSWLL